MEQVNPEHPQDYNKEVSECHKFFLKCLDRFFKAYHPSGIKALEFGGGTSVSNLISAATKCKEIVFSEFSESKREWISRWLRNDPSTFNRQPLFSYVVCTLEGGMENEIEERMELVRNVVKAVVPCDIFQPEPVEDKGPYDIVSTSLCLEYMCLTNEEYRDCVTKLAHLVKPGGNFLMQVHENVHSQIHAGESLKVNPISKEIVREILLSAGFCHIITEFLPRKSLSADVLEKTPDITSVMFIAATKDKFGWNSGSDACSESDI